MFETKEPIRMGYYVVRFPDMRPSPNKDVKTPHTIAIEATITLTKQAQPFPKSSLVPCPSPVEH